jgi:hypothetical protein
MCKEEHAKEKSIPPTIRIRVASRFRPMGRVAVIRGEMRRDDIDSDGRDYQVSDLFN